MTYLNQTPHYNTNGQVFANLLIRIIPHFLPSIAMLGTHPLHARILSAQSDQWSVVFIRYSFDACRDSQHH